MHPGTEELITRARERAMIPAHAAVYPLPSVRSTITHEESNMDWVIGGHCRSHWNLLAVYSSRRRKVYYSARES